MRNYLHILLSIFFLQLSFTSFSQCPTAGFLLPDSACEGSLINLTNNSTGSNLSYHWDFNSSDLNLIPQGNIIGTFPAELASSLGIDFAYDNGNYYAFSINTNAILTRFDFGSSIDNVPVPTTIGNLGLLFSTLDLQVVNDNGNWYGLINGNTQIFRLDFGSSLTNTPTASLVNVPSSLFATPIYMSLQKLGNNYYATVCNFTGNNLTIIDFGSTISNSNPTSFNIALPNGNPISAALTMDCDSLFGIVGYGAGYPLALINFGTTITSTPISTVPLTTNTATAFRRIELLKESSKYFVLAHTFGGEAMQLFDFGQHINNLNPSAKYLGGFGSLVSGCYTYGINKIGSSWIGMTTNYSTGDLIKFKFPEITSGLNDISTDFEPSIAYDNNGMFVITLTVTDTVSQTSSQYTDSIFINQLPNTGFTYNGACEGSIVIFNDTTQVIGGNIVQQNWSFDSFGTANGDSVTFTFPSGGDYNITLEAISNSGCSSDYTTTINIAPLPTAQFSFLNNQCAESNIFFSNTSLANQGVISNYNWSFGDNTFSTDSIPVHSYSGFGNFNVQLIVTANGCLDTLIAPITIIEKPQASFSTFNTCVGETTFFQNTSIFSGAGTSTSNWNFGDSQSSTLDSPTHQYSTIQGIYNVQLIQTGPNGCSDTLNKTTKIGLAPNPDFSISRDTACAGNLITLTDLSIPSIGDTIIYRYWNFGDGSYDSTSINPSHSYINPGLYTIELTVVSPTYCDSIITKSVFVIESPIAHFTTTNVCLNNNTPFNDLSTPAVGSSITNWTWSFGDGDSSFTQNVSHQYNSSGTFNATLEVTSSEGCIDVYTDTTVVYSLPDVNFTTSKLCTGTEVTFQDSSVSQSGNIASWNWDFGDGNSSTLQNPENTFNDPFVFGVELTITTTFGCTDSLIKYLIINQSPKFSITTTENCFNKLSQLQYLPFPGSSTNVGYLWELGDLTFSTNPNPQHIYNSPGTYYVNLSVTNLGNTCVTKVTDSIIVYPLPTANFLIDSACVNKDLQLSDLSTISFGSIQNYLWTIGNYGTSLLQNPIINISNPDSIPIKLVVSSNFGCKDSITNVIKINPLPNVTFTPDPIYGAPPLLVNFINSSTVDQYTWNFGDGSSTQNGSNPSHTFSDTGVYVVNLTATTNKGCVDSSFRNVTVIIPNTDLSLETVNFTNIEDYWQLTCRLNNNGNQNANSFILKAQLDGKSPIIELFDNDTILSGQTKFVKFNSKFAASKSDKPGFACIEILEVNNSIDDDLTNNRKCITLGSEFEIFNVYPTPFGSEFTVDMTIPLKGTVSFTIYNLLGQKVVDPVSFSVQKGYNSYTYSTNQITSGMFLLEIRYNDLSKVVRIMKN